MLIGLIAVGVLIVVNVMFATVIALIWIKERHKCKSSAGKHSSQLRRTGG